MDIQKILEYQKKDFEIIKYERQITESEDKKILEKLVFMVKDSQNTSTLLEKDAEEAILRFKDIKTNYIENNKKFEILKNINLDNLKEEEKNEIVNQLSELANLLSNLEKKLLNIADKINTIISNFDGAKKQYETAKQRHHIHKAKYKKLISEVNPEIEKLKKNLKILEEKIDPKFIAKYNSIRQDNIFPIVVPLIENTCGGCMIELSMAQIQKLKKEKFLECENCKRIIYLK